MKSAARAILGCLAIAVAACSNVRGSDVPKPDYSNYGAYIIALSNSSDPRAVAIRHEIADGPKALARARRRYLKLGGSLARTQSPVPPNQNALALYLQYADLARQQHVVFPYYASPLRLEYVYPHNNLVAIQSIFNDHPKVFSLLRQAASKPAVSGSGRAFSRADSAMHEGSRELTTESLLLSRRGDYSAAIADQSLVLNMSHQTGRTPGYIPYVISYSNYTRSLTGFGNILDIAGPNKAVDSRIEQVLLRSGTGPSLKQAIQGSMLDVDQEMQVAQTLSPRRLTDLISEPQRLASAFLVMAGMSHSTMPPLATPLPSSFTPKEKLVLRNLCDKVEAQFMDQMADLIEADKQSPGVRRAVFERFYAKYPMSGVDPGAQADPVASLLSVQLSPFGSLGRRDTLQKADLEMTLAAADILKTKAVTGAFPKRSPAAFIDPFSGKPFKLRSIGKSGFIIYTVGPNGSYTGGEPGEWDLRFQYPHPQAKPIPTRWLKD